MLMKIALLGNFQDNAWKKDLTSYLHVEAYRAFGDNFQILKDKSIQDSDAPLLKTATEAQLLPNVLERAQSLLLGTRSDLTVIVDTGEESNSLQEALMARLWDKGTCLVVWSPDAIQDDERPPKAAQYKRPWVVLVRGNLDLLKQAVGFLCGL